MEKIHLKLLLIIVAVASILRLGYLTFAPPSLNWDEVSQGYNSFSILKTGMDQWGEKFPVFNFRAYGDYPTTLNLYLTVPFIFFFGLSDFSIRFPHAVLGILTVIAVYFAAFGIFRKQFPSLLTAMLVAVGPWYFFTSRFVLQSNLSVFLMSGALAFFLNKDRNKHFLTMSLFAIFLSLFSYHTTRIFSPLIVLGAGMVYAREIYGFVNTSKIYGFLFVGIVFSFFVLSGYILQNPAARARGSVLFLLDQGAINQIETKRNNSKLPELARRLLYNRPIYFAKSFIKNYMGYFSPEFLFFKGGTQYQFSLPGKGLMYPVNLVFFYIGILVLLYGSVRSKNYRLLALWLILAPIPASLTNEKFAVVRATTLLPVTEIITVMGLYSIVGKIKPKYVNYLVGIYLVVIYISLELFLTDYMASYRTNYSWSWQFGYKQVVDSVTKRYAEYDKILMTKKYGEPHEYVLFYQKFDPARYQNDKTATKFEQSGWFWVDGFDKFYFLNDWQIVDGTRKNKSFVQESRKTVDCYDSKCLLVTSPGNVPLGWHKIEVINFLDGSPAFEIYDNSAKK